MNNHDRRSGQFQQLLGKRNPRCNRLAMRRRREFEPKRSGRAKSTEMIVGGAIIGLLVLGVLLFAVGGIGTSDHSSKPTQDGSEEIRLDEIGQLGTHDRPVLCIAVSPDAKLVATGNDDGNVLIWDAATGSQTNSFAHGNRGIHAIAFSPDGTRLAAGSDDGKVQIYNVKSGSETKTFDGHTGPVHCIAFYPFGNYVLSGGEDRSVLLWDSTSGDVIHRYSGQHGTVTCLAFSADGRTIAMGSTDKAVRIWDVTDDRKTLHTFKGHSSPIAGVRFSPDGKTLLSAATTGNLRSWDVASGNELASDQFLSGDNDRLESFEVSPGGTRAILGCSDHIVRFYDLESGARGAGAAHHTAGVSGVCCSPDASFVYSASRDKTVRIWSLPQPSMTELANIQRRAKQLQSRANGLKEYAKHMQQGKAAADGEDINAAQREFEAARSVVEKGTLEFQIADNALDRVHTAEQNKDQYVALMKSGEEATKKGDYYEARRDFESAKRIFPNRPEAKQALKRVDEAIETKSVLKTAKAKPTLEFDFSQGDRDLLEIGSNFAWLYNREEIRKASRRRSFFLFSKPDVPEAPLGLNSSPLRWTVSMTTKKGIPADNLKVRLRLQKLTGNKVIAEQDYPLSKGERNHFFVGKGGPPEGGWTAGDYHFRKFLVVKLDSDETRKGGASERIEELGSPATFSIGLINWSTKKLELKPQNIQQSAQYETSAGLTIREGDVFRFDASGKVTPATVGFYRAFWNVDVAKPKPAGPEGIPFNGRAPKRGFYRLRVENRPFAAVLYRFDSAKSPAWFSHGKGTTHGLCQSTSEVFVSINSVVATRKSRKNKFKEVPKSKHSYWLPECGSFHVKLHHGVFDFTDQLNSTAKDHLLKPFWK